MMADTSRLKEQKDHGTAVFPCGLYEVEETCSWKGVKHHWHDEIEILYFGRESFCFVLIWRLFGFRKNAFTLSIPANCIPLSL